MKRERTIDPDLCTYCTNPASQEAGGLPLCERCYAAIETVFTIPIQPTRCVICARPTPAVTLGPWPLCDVCAAARDAPDGMCWECGLPLSEAEIAGGEVWHADCGAQ